MKKVLLGVVVLIALAIGAAFFNLPAGFLQGPMAQWVKQETGRDLTIKGNTSVRLLPTILVRLEGVSLGNPSGVAGPPLLQTAVIEASPEFMPLLQRQVRLSSLKLEAPVIELTVDKDGRSSWQDLIKSQPNSAPPPAIAEVLVRNGTLAYRDERAGRQDRLEQINASFNLPAREPLRGQFDGVLNKVPLNGKVTLDSLGTIAAGTPTRTTLALSTSNDRLELDGSLSAGADPSFNGKAKGSTPSLRGLAKWIGLALPDGSGLEKVDLDSELTANARGLNASNVRLTLDDTTAQGSLSVDISGARPAIAGKITANKLDVSRYVPQLAQLGGRSQLESARAPAVEIVQVPLKDSLKTYLRAVKSGSVPGGTLESSSLEAMPASAAVWSEEPIDFSPLKRVDLDLDLTVNELKVGAVESGIPNMKVALRDGRLSLNGQGISAYGGQISGTADVDAQAAVPQLKTSIKAQKIELHNLFRDLGLQAVVAGKASVDANLTSAGSNQKQIISALSGRLATDIGQGAIVGWNVSRDWGRMIIERSAGPYDGSDRTPFNRLAADVTVDKGDAKSSKLDIDGPVIGVGVEGRAKLVTGQIDLRARVAAAIPPPLRLPLRISGTFDRVRVAVDPDAGGLLGVFASLFENTSAAASPELVDTELESLVGEVIEKTDAGKTLGPDAPEALLTLQKRARGAAQ